MPFIYRLTATNLAPWPGFARTVTQRNVKISRMSTSLSATKFNEDLVENGAPDGLSFAQLEAGAQAAEEAFAAGRYRAALGAYGDLLHGRLATAASLGAADLVVIERLAELATLFGWFEAADNLLEAMVVLCREAKNELAADYAHMKRVELALARGRTHDSFDLLGELRDRIGNLEELDLSMTGLVRWEISIEWRRFPAPDRTVLLTRAYLVMGQILAANGRYGDALRVIARGLAHAENVRAPDLAQRAGVPMRLARVAALL